MTDVTNAELALLAIALAATWAMVGVIWTIQLVHYPIFDAVERGADDRRWAAFGERHRRAISLVVGPFMAVEGATGLWLVVDPPGGDVALPVVALVLLAVAYGTTAFVFVPLHGRLTDRFEPEAHRRLVALNWIRTVAWTMRGVVLVAIPLTV